jgi:glycosyltransferase involved in cell wall biosynthesis
MNKYQLSELDLKKCALIINKLDRVVRDLSTSNNESINHGRAVYWDKKNKLYYKVFNKGYIRRQNFITAYEAGFFDKLAPALIGLIYDDEDVVGYVTKEGKLLSDSEFDFKVVPEGFLTLLKETIKDTNLFYYDLVPLNIIKVDEKLSLIDLESVYQMDDLYDLDKHQAKIKPPELKDFLVKLKNEVDSNRVISFIQPSRNNLKYLKWSYHSIRKNLGYRHEICWADDFSNDGTWEWMKEIADKDYNVKIHRNEGPNRLGHTILYDKLVDMATNDIIMIYHADMYTLPGLDTEVFKHIKRGVVVSATRVEPPLHPDGPEKIIMDFGIEPEEFKEHELWNFWEEHVSTREDETTRGIFAPWAMYKDDFLAIGGHDPLFAPQSKEDSDIFNRFVLAGYDLKQTWKGLVYHMTSRGSRFKDGAIRNPDGQVFMKGRESDEWLKQNRRSTRNFVRKWGHFVMHDELMYPIIPPKYDVAFSIYNCTPELMAALEPWCSVIYSDVDPNDIESYIKAEQPNTLYDLTERVRYITEDKDNDVVIEFDGSQWKDKHSGFINNLTQILKDSGEVGTMDYEIFTLYIEKLETYEKELIKL